MESPHKDLAAALQSGRCWFAGNSRPQRDGYWGAGFRLVEDQFHWGGILAAQVASAGKCDPVEKEMNRMLCHPGRGEVRKRHKTYCSGSSAPLARLAHG